MKTCERCDESLAGRDPRARFCSENCRKRAWDDTRYRGTCEDCGGVTRRPERTRCKACQRAADRRLVDARDSIIAGMWADGATWPEIGEAFGWTQDHTSAELGRIRQEKPGLLPYRYSEERRELARTRRGKEAA